MYLVANSRITIGNVLLKACNSVEIEQSITEFDTKCVIKLPRNMVKKGDKGVTDFIHKGDKVLIELGYNGLYFEEFNGFIDVIGSDTPLSIECANEWFLFKKNKLNKSFPAATLKEVLSYAFAGFAIDCPDVRLGKFLITNASSYEVAKGLKDSTGFVAKLDVQNKKLSCYWAFDMKAPKMHTYVFGTRNEKLISGLISQKLFPNVKKNDLKFERKDDLKIQIEAIAPKVNGKKMKVTVGSKEPNAEKRTRNYGYEIKTEAELKAAAEKDLAKWKYDGYRGGTITGFGTPRTEAGDSLKLIDPENPEREGTYLIEKVVKRYNADSATFERENTISYKI